MVSFSDTALKVVEVFKVVKGNFHTCSVWCYSQGTQMPPPMAFFSITDCNFSILYLCINSPLKYSHLEEKLWIIITSENTYSLQTNISFNEPPPLFPCC